MKSRTKEAKSRRPVTADHEVIAGTIAVLEEAQGGPMTSVAIFRRGVERGLFEPHQYNTVRARLSQHCDLTDARVIRAHGTKIGVRGSRTTAWVLREHGGIQVRTGRYGPEAVMLDMRARVRPREQHVIPGLCQVLTDDVLGPRVPAAVRGVAGRTMREALTSDIDADAVRWLLAKLPLEPRLRGRLEALARDAEGRTAIIEGAERRKA